MGDPPQETGPGAVRIFPEYSRHGNLPDTVNRWRRQFGRANWVTCRYSRTKIGARGARGGRQPPCLRTPSAFAAWLEEQELIRTGRTLG